jgi:hypothetical protein
MRIVIVIANTKMPQDQKEPRKMVEVQQRFHSSLIMAIRIWQKPQQGAFCQFDLLPSSDA